MANLILTVLDCSNVAAHVQADTIPDAIRPGLTERDAVLNSSDCFVEYAVYLFCIREMPIIRKAKKKPMPTTTPELRLAVVLVKVKSEPTIAGTDR